MKFRHKYKAKKTSSRLHPGFSFASQLEADVFDHLMAMEHDGEIKVLQTQAEVKLTEAKVTYKPDFLIEKDGKQVWVEAKGFETPEWRLKKRLWKHYGPGDLWIYMRYAQRGVVLTEILKPV